VAARVDGDHFELPADAAELLRQVHPADQQWFIGEVTQALAVAAETKDFRRLQEVLEAWTATVRLQLQPGYEAMIQRMQRRERGQPVELDELRALAARAVRWRVEQAEEFCEEVERYTDAEG
jgi:sulfite reductase beta subunit-like hemoprotein